MSKPFVLRTYADRLHAELARSVLESEGIEAFVSASEGMAGGYVTAYMGEGVTPHELQVPEEMAAEAEAILQETEAGEWEVDDEGEPVEHTAAAATSTCPVCHGPVAKDDATFTRIWQGGVFAVVLLFATWYPASYLPAPVPLIYDVATALVATLGLWILRGYFVRARCGHCGRRRAAR